MIDFSLAIPTYNGAERLAVLLEKIRQQINTESLSWEVIVVDNNSSDRTAQIVQEYQTNWSKNYPLKYVFEAEQGAAFARQAAVEAARGSLIGFLDDDNLPEPNWVATAYEFGKLHPEAGAYGSQILGKFETKPPENFQRVASFFAIIERGNTAHRYEPQKKILPPGAGLVVRRQAWLENVPKRLVLNHKGKEEGLASEDLEALIYIQKAGWEIWYNPQMLVYHDIPSWRLETEYLVSVTRCIGLSRHQLRMLRLKNWQKPLLIPLYFTNDLYRLLKHYFKYSDSLKKDAIALCELELLRSSLISPFFLWKKRYLDLQVTKKA